MFMKPEQLKQERMFMKLEQLKQEWNELANSWIKESREGRNANRIGLLDEPMLNACGNIHGLKIIDVGCGEGRFCRILTKLGAKKVLGVDLCEPMINAAKELQSQNEDYQIADAQNLKIIKNETFDLAISYLNQCDLFDFEKNNKEVYRILKNGGKFIITNLHPMRSANAGWCKDNNGKKNHVNLDNYFNENERRWKMLGVEFTNFHRTLATYINSFIEVGFTLEKIIEPTITLEQLKTYPELEDELRVPNFIIYILKKINHLNS